MDKNTAHKIRLLQFQQTGAMRFTSMLSWNVLADYELVGMLFSTQECYSVEIV